MSVPQLKLGVNIDHVATLREARYRGRERGEPDPVEAALICEASGAHGITIHLREDRRHILDRDVLKVREVVKTRLNLEMALSEEIIQIALDARPDIVCLVPEKRQELTTEGGLDVAGQLDAVKRVVERMRGAGIETSLFIDPDPAQIAASAASGAEFVELHTGAFAERWNRKKERAEEIARLIRCATQARALGVGVNAGHGLNYQNISGLFTVPHLVELNIGHAIVSRALTVGLSVAVREMLMAMAPYADTAKA